MSSFISFFRRSQHYDRISSESDDPQSPSKPASESPTEDLDDKDESAPGGKRETSQNVIFFLTLVCVVCTLANLLVLRITEFKEANPPKPTNLRRPSQFPGLDKIERPVPPIERSIVNFPFVVARVDQRNPRKIVPNDAPNGIANGNRVKVTNDVSTILQFRALDWGMESCQLRVRIPGEETMMGIHHMNATSSFVFGSTHNHIYVHELVSESKGPVETVINGKTLTYSTSPALGEKIGSLHLEYGFEWSHTFPCAMDSLHAFALVAADDVTHVEWWQDKQSLLPAVYIEQHATK